MSMYRSSRIERNHQNSALCHGSLYGITNTITLSSTNDTHFVQIKTPSDKNIHLFWEIQADKAIETYLYEGATEQTNGSSVTPLNMNRNSSSTTSVEMRSGVSSPASTGTTIETVKQGIDTRRIKTGMSEDGEGVILKKGTVYIRKFVAKADDVNIVISPRWIEE